MHRHYCINHDPHKIWEHDPEEKCLEPAEALCDECYEQQTRLDLAQKVYQAGMSYASGQFD